MQRTGARLDLRRLCRLALVLNWQHTLPTVEAHHPVKRHTPEAEILPQTFGRFH